MDTGSAQIPVDIVRQNNKAATSTAEPPESPTFAHYPEPGFYDDEKVTKPPPNTKKTKDQIDPKRRSSRRPFQPHFQTGDLLTKEGDSNQSALSTTTCHDIIQSKSLYDTNDPEREKVFLTSKTDSDFTDFHNSFRWIHHQRVLSPVSLSEFEIAISTMTGLYEDEMAVATKCLREARSARKMSALGRFFDQTIYKARTVLQNAGDSTPVQATFVSIPVVALFPDQGTPGQKPRYPSSKEIRSSDYHPIRSLLQYSNILAIDGERDRQQVITRIKETYTDAESFVHVPEVWALIINMYTIVTCAPFSVKELCGENVKLDIEDSTEGLQGKAQTIIKYTDLKGTLRDFQIRTWPGLLDSIARLENRPELINSLMDPGPEYKIVDLKFQPVERQMWNELLEYQNGQTNYVHLRLLKLDDSDPLNLDFAHRKLKTFHLTTFGYLAVNSVLQHLQQKLSRSRKDFFKLRVEEVQRLQRRIEAVKQNAHDLWRSRNRNRLLLYATKYYLLHADAEKDRRYRWPSITSDASRRHSSGPGAQTTSVRKPESSSSSSAVPTNTKSNASVTTTLSPPSVHAPPEVRLEPASSPTLRPTDIPRIVVGDDDGSDVWSIDGTAFVDEDAYEDADGSEPLQRATSKSQLPTIALFGSSARADLDVEAQITSTDRSRRWDRVRRSSIGAHDDILLSQQSSAISSSGRPNLALRHHSRHRRHSFAELQANDVPGILDASPLRRPFDMPDTRAYMISSEPQDTTKVADVQAAQERRFIHTSRPPVLERQISNTVREPERWNLRDLLSHPVEKALPSIRPFFEWSIVDSQHSRRQSLHPVTVSLPNGQASAAAGVDVRSPILEHGAQVLDFFDRQLKSDLPYQGVFSKPNLPLGSQLYEKISTKTIDDIIALLEAEHRHVAPGSCTQSDFSLDINPDALLHDWKVQLFVSIHALAQCFINQDDQHAEVFRKLWGIVYDICALQGKSEKSLVYPNRHEVQYIRLASTHIHATAESCRHMLEDVWQDTDADPTTWEPVFPQQLELAFQSIVVYLLVIRHATTSYGFEVTDIEIAGNQIVNFFQEADYELMGMRVLRDAPNRPVTAESIRTAETLLGLLLENAFEICNTEPTDQGHLPTSSSPHFDLRHVYSKYTSSCIIRAKREATARVYKDIKLLLEEIDTVKALLKQQRKLFLDVTKKRESAKQLLDIRLNRRTLTQFEDMIEHFEKLHGLAKQAEFWARHSIEVRGEQNGKFIYVFTAVTVIFLPLSFVAGLLGMNTSDIRKMHDGQWLFWVVAIPFTIGVLIICLMIANVRLKRRINAIMRWLVRCCGRRLRGL